MGRRSGYVIQHKETNQKGYTIHSEQNDDLLKKGKLLIHYTDEDFRDLMINDKPKTGIVNAINWKTIGMRD